MKKSEILTSELKNAKTNIYIVDGSIDIRVTASSSREAKEKFISYGWNNESHPGKTFKKVGTIPIPSVRMWIDESSIYWLSENQGPIWIADHRGSDDFIDDNHQIEERQYGEGVGNKGIEWNNADFENPFHVSDFTDRIETINSFHF